jgi:lipopolysaccharide/colanic/teichoic acid biosynthesis glycosyltransferase
MAKRLFDIAVSLLVLLLLALPMLAIAAWIRLDSPGPVFFGQQRVGRHGVPFVIHKFRTMRHVAEGGAPRGEGQAVPAHRPGASRLRP